MPKTTPKRGAPRKRQLKEKLSLTISPEMRAKLERIARRERRSLSSMVEYLTELEIRRFESAKKPPDPRTNTGIYRLTNTVP